MALKCKTKFKSSGKLKSAISKAQRARSIERVEVGFYHSARYPDGTPVTSVAAWNEFGTKRNGKQHVPPRPFFRQANEAAKPVVKEFMEQHIDPKTLHVTTVHGEIVGNLLKSNLQRSIVKLREPPNAPATMRAKDKMKGKRNKRYGKHNPLIMTGKMHISATYKVIP